MHRQKTQIRHKDKPVILGNERRTKQELKHIPAKRRVIYFPKSTRVNWKGVMLFPLLAVAAYAASQTAQEDGPIADAIRDARPTKTSQDKHSDICGNTKFPTNNKPNVTVGAKNGVIQPKSCVLKPNSKVCKQEMSAWNAFTKKNISPLREQLDLQYNTWVKTVLMPFHSRTVPTLNNKEFEIYNQVIAGLKQLTKHNLHAKLARDRQEGFCDEHLAMDAIEVINNDLKYNLNTKIQVVQLPRKHSITNRIGGHTYLLLNSDVEDVSIKNNPKEVAAYLKKITKGKICDSWNKGYYTDFKGDNSGFYDEHAGWDTLKVETISLHLDKLQVLPKEIQKFFCEQYKKLGLFIQQKLLCRKFDRAEKSNGCETAPSNKAESCPSYSSSHGQ